MILAHSPLSTAAKDIAAETGRGHRPVADGQRVGGIYRRSVTLARGRYVMPEDGMGFSLVPWKPFLEQRRGQTIMATLWRGNLMLELVSNAGLRSAQRLDLENA